MAPKRRDLASQTLKFEDVTFATYRPVVKPVAATSPKAESGRPAGTGASDPYWEFSWQVTSDTGLKLTNLVARDALTPGSTQTVAELVDFTDLKVLFSDSGSTLENFPVAAAFAHKESKFEYGINGISMASGTADPLYQQGMMLTLVHDFGGTCRVTLRLCVVFRGPAHDFDPGGVPYSLNFYPQIGYTWQSMGTSRRRVKQFRGSVRILVNNQTSAFGSMSAVAENVANFWTDSNISRNPGENRPQIMFEGCTADTWVPYRGIYFHDERPFGWGLVFDYNRMDLQEEQEYESVYGPLDDAMKYYTTRRNLYQWPASGATKVANFKVEKTPRQGYYDNIHLHGRMHHKDPKGNEQIHAPFCGHSCVHLHWRWSNISANNAENNRGWYYKGWSSDPPFDAFSEAGSPLIPPNQKLTVAICAPSRTRTSDTKILPAAGSRLPLDKLRKLIWYCVDVQDGFYAKLNAGEQQVIFEHGIGWAYRYALDTESDAVDGLLNVFKDNPATLTQANLMDFFETKIYPGFRYWTARGITTNQVPEGTYDEVMAGTRQTMEEL